MLVNVAFAVAGVVVLEEEEDKSILEELVAHKIRLSED